MVLLSGMQGPVVCPGDTTVHRPWASGAVFPARWRLCCYAHACTRSCERALPCPHCTHAADIRWHHTPSHDSTSVMSACLRTHSPVRWRTHTAPHTLLPSWPKNTCPTTAYRPRGDVLAISTVGGAARGHTHPHKHAGLTPLFATHTHQPRGPHPLSAICQPCTRPYPPRRRKQSACKLVVHLPHHCLPSMGRRRRQPAQWEERRGQTHTLICKQRSGLTPLVSMHTHLPHDATTGQCPAAPHIRPTLTPARTRARTLPTYAHTSHTPTYDLAPVPHQRARNTPGREQDPHLQIHTYQPVSTHGVTPPSAAHV